jgi:hypothetical protein
VAAVTDSALRGGSAAADATAAAECAAHPAPWASRGISIAAHTLDLLAVGLSALRLFVEPTCLTRGLTRCYFLRRAGFDVELAFGMNGTPGLGGHRWLVRGGQPFLESHDPRPAFAEMFRI